MVETLRSNAEFALVRQTVHRSFLRVSKKLRTKESASTSYHAVKYRKLVECGCFVARYPKRVESGIYLALVKRMGWRTMDPADTNEGTRRRRVTTPTEFDLKVAEARDKAIARSRKSLKRIEEIERLFDRLRTPQPAK